MENINWSQVLIQIGIGAFTAAINGTFLLVATRVTSKALDRIEKRNNDDKPG